MSENNSKMTENNNKMIGATSLGELIADIAKTGYENISSYQTDNTYTDSLILKGDVSDIMETIGNFLDDWNDENKNYKMDVICSQVYGVSDDIRKYEFTLTLDVEEPDFDVEDVYGDEDLCEVIDPATLPKKPVRKITEEQRAQFAEARRLAAERRKAEKEKQSE